MTPVVVAIDARGAALARRLAAALAAETHGLNGRAPDTDLNFDGVADHLCELFIAGRPIIGVFSAGIMVRSIGGLAIDKRSEPPVLVVSADGAHIAPLLGGHRGANDLALRIAAITGGCAAITTAGDVIHGAALDAPPVGWRLANPEAAKPVMARIANGEAFSVRGELPFELAGHADPDAPLSLCGDTTPAGAMDGLHYYPQRHVLGVGSARGCPPDELRELARQALSEAGIAEGAVACIASIDLKADEPAMLALAETLDAPLRLFDAAALEAETPRLVHPSARVFAEVGCHGVAEGAALAAVGPAGALICPKRKSANATLAVAQAPAPLDAARIGRARGAVHIVGIGPGAPDWRAPEASRRIAAADELVGYGLYLDLVAALAPKRRMTEFPLGQETERCAHALERAATGRTVALICSGDAGIYALATLVEELIADGKVSDAARRVAVTVTPGISALQAAAARAGAPLGHDFCAISLSDLLTPWAQIENRVRAAAAGDFVIAFFNPASQRRRTQLAQAQAILLAARPAATPVILATNLGRTGERLHVTSLGELQVADVDMLTIVIVGSSATRTHVVAGRTRVFTPRGYAGKQAPS